MIAEYKKKGEDASALEELFDLWRRKEQETFEYTHGKRHIQISIYRSHR